MVEKLGSRPDFVSQVTIDLCVVGGRRMINRVVFLGSALLLIATPVFGQASELAEQLGLGRQNVLSDSKIASGLKEALQAGADNAVKLTGRLDGYLATLPSRFFCRRTCRRSTKGSVPWATARGRRLRPQYEPSG
jgi:hypothetical protein